MKKTFFVNVLFGDNRDRIFEQLKRVLISTNSYRFQVHPFRINTNSLSSNNEYINQKKTEISHHLDIMKEINASGINRTASSTNPFSNTIFVNYTTKELEPALRLDRIELYLCDFINEDNIEVLTSVAPHYINFLNNVPRLFPKSINSHFINYSILIFNDSNADRRISDSTSLDIGEESTISDNITFLLRNTRIDDGNEGDIRTSFILPYHPFRYSMFTSIQNIKNSINLILGSLKKPHAIYYPFSQNEWLLIMQSIMHEHLLLNFLISDNLYREEHIKIIKGLQRHNVSYHFVYLKRIQKKHKTHILNELVFDYKNAFSCTENRWYNTTTLIKTTPHFATNVFGTRSNNGIFI